MGDWPVTEELLAVLVTVDASDLESLLDLQRVQFKALLAIIEDLELGIESLAQMLVMSEPDLNDFQKRRAAPAELRLKLRQNFFYKDGELTTLLAPNPRFNIVQHSNCKDLKYGGQFDPSILHLDWMAKCIEQVPNRLANTEACSQQLISHVLEICQYFFQKHTLSYMAPQLLDYRMFHLLTQLIYEELFLLISPHRMNHDFALLFNVRNYSVFASVIAPCGRIAEGY